MDIFFHDPSEVPLPPEQVRILEAKAMPYPDRRRVKVYIEVTPFLKRPSAEVLILDPDDNVVAEADIIETMARRIELTLHLRDQVPAEQYKLKVNLFYQMQEEPGLPGTAPAESNPGAPPEYHLPERIPVDSAETIFTL